MGFDIGQPEEVVNRGVYKAIAPDRVIQALNLPLDRSAWLWRSPRWRPVDAVATTGWNVAQPLDVDMDQ
jgi:hypothetical protein